MINDFCYKDLFGVKRFVQHIKKNHSYIEEIERGKVTIVFKKIGSEL